MDFLTLQTLQILIVKMTVFYGAVCLNLATGFMNNTNKIRGAKFCASYFYSLLELVNTCVFLFFSIKVNGYFITRTSPYTWFFYMGNIY